MSTLPTKITQDDFSVHILPHLSTAKRGFTCKIGLCKVFNYILYWLHTGCQWHRLPIEPDPNDAEKKEISYHAVYYHFRKWCRDGSLERVWKNSILCIKDQLDLSALNLDGTHVIAKKGGESVAYQGRKKAKTTNILPLLDAKGFIVEVLGVASGNHHDSYELKPHLQKALGALKKRGLSIAGALFNADKAFDTRAARKTCFNHGVVPNICPNARGRKTTKRGRPQLFDPQRYKERFVAERSFAWVDKFKRLLVRFERKDDFFLGAHHIAFALLNLRHILASD